MTITLPSQLKPAPPLGDPDADALVVRIRDQLWTAAATSPRSQQLSVGASEIGTECLRKLAYRMAGTTPVNHPDPLRAMVGLGVHLQLADTYRRLDAGTGRYLVEHPVTFRDVPGTVDLFDRLRGDVVDWKSTTTSRVKLYRKDGPSPGYVTQAQMYAAALAAEGETPRRVSLVFIPTDGTLADIWAWGAPVDSTVADAAVDQLDTLRHKLPADVPATPTRLCPWCSHYRPGSTDLRVGCPGKEGPAS